MQCNSLTVAKPDPIADALQVLKGNTTFGAFRGSHNAFTDIVVKPCAKACFLAGQFAQTSFGRVRAFCLQFLAQPAMSIAHSFQGFALIELPVAIHSKIDNHPCPRQAIL